MYLNSVIDGMSLAEYNAPNNTMVVQYIRYRRSWGARRIHRDLLEGIFVLALSGRGQPCMTPCRDVFSSRVISGN